MEHRLERGRLYDLSIENPGPGEPESYARVRYEGLVYAHWLGHGPAETWVCFTDESSTEIRLKPGTFTAKPADN